MTKKILSSLAFFVFIFAAESSFAAKICLVDNWGGYWELRGGKVDKKTYTAKVIFNAGASVCGGYADATLTNSGGLVVELFNSHGAAAECNSVLWSATTDLLFNGAGEYDIFGDGSIDGTFNITSVNCSSLPTTLSKNKTDPNQRTTDPNHPALPKY